jgi:hypothetical protein
MGREVDGDPRAAQAQTVLEEVDGIGLQGLPGAVQDSKGAVVVQDPQGPEWVYDPRQFCLVFFP